MTFIPTASRGSINSRSKRSIKISRFLGCSVYCLNSTTGQQSGEDRSCFELSPIGAVMAHLSIPTVEMKKNQEAGLDLKHLTFELAEKSATGKVESRGGSAEGRSERLSMRTGLNLQAGD